MSVLRHFVWLMTNLCRPKPQEEALMVSVCLVCVYVCAAPLCVADDQSVSPKASGGGTDGVCDWSVCMSVLRHSSWLMTNLCRPKPPEEAQPMCLCV
jgi:hypothetical protein